MLCTKNTCFVVQRVPNLVLNGQMDPRDDRRELRLAAQSAAIALLAVVLAQVMSLSTAPIALAATFLLWLTALLAGTRAVVAVGIAVWRRRRGEGPTRPR